MAANSVRSYDVQGRSTETFGRVLCSAQKHHFIVDGPSQNGCPGEAVTPAELFLSGVAACGVELVQVIGKEQGVTIPSLTVGIRGSIDRSKPSRPDVTLFQSVEIRFDFRGIDPATAADLVERFKQR